MKLQVGDLVWIRRPRMRDGDVWYRARVLKVGRVWAEFAKSDAAFHTPWKLRLDTQDNGSDHTYSERWYTDEQRRELEVERSVYAFFNEQKIHVDYASPWYARRVELAQLLGWKAPERAEWEE